MKLLALALTQASHFLFQLKQTHVKKLRRRRINVKGGLLFWLTQR